MPRSDPKYNPPALRLGDSALRESDTIQGNILAPFPEDYQAFLFLRVSDLPKGKMWLHGLLQSVTTTRDLTAACEQAPTVCCSVSFTWAGLCTLAPDVRSELESFEAFRQGPATRAAKVRDRDCSAPEHWLFGGYTRPEPHVILTLASVHQAVLESQITRYREMVADYDIECLYLQRGGLLPGAMAGREHFGFKDGISQPAIRGFDFTSSQASSLSHLIPAGEFILGHLRLAPDGTDAAPLLCPPWMRDGSFQVLKRLNQDVAGWRAQLAATARALSGRCAISEELLAAKLLGRWPSGAPLALSPLEDSGSPYDEAFSFDDDPHGFNTPRFAHIRKMYPRSATVTDRNWHRIIRRGVPFGPIYDPALASSHAAVDRGLIMNAFMVSIEQQFEFLLRGWAHDPDFFESGDGPDPIIGSDPAPVTLRLPGSAPEALCFSRFVHTSGAVYAFVPSYPALEWLSLEHHV